MMLPKLTSLVRRKLTFPSLYIHLFYADGHSGESIEGRRSVRSRERERVSLSVGRDRNHFFLVGSLMIFFMNHGEERLLYNMTTTTRNWYAHRIVHNI